VLVGRDNNTYFSIGATETGNSGGRIRAVTASVKAVPIGQGLWTVTVTNASSGPITDLEVDVYGVDGEGNRLDDACHPAKGKVSVQELFREILSGGMSGTLDAIGSRSQSMYPPGMLAGMPANLGAYGGMFTDHILTAPGLSSTLRNAQQQMVDKYPQVIPRDQSSEVLYSAPRVVEVRVDLRFADDVGNLWHRRHGQQPEPVMDGDDS
jgi:hypothetical protein